MPPTLPPEKTPSTQLSGIGQQGQEFNFPAAQVISPFGKLNVYCMMLQFAKKILCFQILRTFTRAN